MSIYELDDAIRIRDEIEDVYESADGVKRDFDDAMVKLSQLNSRAQGLYSHEYADEFAGELDDVVQMLSNIVDGMDEVRAALESVEV